MRSNVRFSLSFLVAFLPVIAFAADRLVTTDRTIEWQSPIDASATVLSVQRPDGEVVTDTFAAGRNPMLRFDKLADGKPVSVAWNSSNLNDPWFGGSRWIPNTADCNGSSWRSVIADGLNLASGPVC